MTTTDTQNPRVWHLWRGPILTWLGLLALLGATVALTRVPLGAGGTAIHMGVTVLQAAMILLFFMNLAWSSAMLRMAALGGLLWLAFMFALTAGDYLTRSPQAGSTPTRIQVD